MTGEEEIHCEWKQLIKVLLPKGYIKMDKSVEKVRQMRGKMEINTLALILTLVILVGVCNGTASKVMDSNKGGKSGDRGKESRIIRTPTSTTHLVGDVGINDSSFASSESEGINRVEKVKAKWKGDKFWAESIANLTLLESQKIEKVVDDDPSSTKPPLDPSSIISSSRKMASSVQPTQSTFFLPVSDSKFRSSSGLLSPPPTAPFTSDPDAPITSDLSSQQNNYTFIIPPTKKIHRNKKHNKRKGAPPPSTKFNLPKKDFSQAKILLKPTKSPGKFVPRTTLTADLSQYGQNYVLEYESSENTQEQDTNNNNKEEEDEVVIIASTTPKVKKFADLKRRPNNKPKKPSRISSTTQKHKSRVRTKTKSKYGSTFGFPRQTNNSSEEMGSTATTIDPNIRATLIADLTKYGQEAYLEYDSDEGSAETGNKTRRGNGTLSLFEFYPKNPTNLLNVLQALASNIQPIKMASPIGGEAPSIPLRYNVNITNRVPVKMNPPTSPFLFSLDLDSFFTRMAISVFYSTVAIAPLVYLMMGGIGGLGGLTGLSLVPFTGKKRRKRSIRNLVDDNNSSIDEDNFDFYNEMELHQLELVIHRFWKFLSQFEKEIMVSGRHR